MQTSEQVHELAAAMAKAQLKLKAAAKDAVNPAFRSRYADLAAVAEAAKVYASEGIAIVQEATSNDAGVSVSTRLLHASGQWLEVGPLTVPVAKRDAHGIGSATTYAKRYSLGAAGLIVAGDEDDDGNAAVAATTPAPVAAPTKPSGYPAWLKGFTASADDGIAALTAAFQAAPADCRTYYQATVAPKDREALKARAREVGAA